MPLISWLRTSVSGTFRKSARRNLFLPRARWHGYTLAIEALEDRTLLSTFQWTGLGGNANWDNTSNWKLTTGTGSFPNAAGDVAQFVVPGGGAETAGTTATVDVPITVSELDFGTSSSISITGTNALTLQGSGASALLDVGAANPNSGGDTIAAPLVVNAATPLTVNVAGNNSLSLSGQVSGGGGLTKNGTGTLTLNAAAGNTYAGTTTVNAGVLTANGPSATGTSNVTVNNGGTLVVAASKAIPPSSFVLVGNGGTLTLPGGVTDAVAALSLQGGNLTGGGTLTSNSTYDMQSGLVSASLAGSVGLTKSTAGTVLLDGTDSYTGTTAVNAGTLVVGGVLTASPVTVTAGATLTGTGFIAGAVTASRGTSSTGGIVVPGSGTLSTGNLSLDSFSAFTSVLGGTMLGQFGQVQASGAVDLNSDSGTGSTLNLSLAAGFTPSVDQTFDIITSTTAPANGTFNGLPEGATFAVGGETFRINYAVSVGTASYAVELTAVAGPPAQVAFGVQPPATTAGAAIAPPLMIQIEDQFGNLVSSDNTDQVTVGIASGPGSFTAASTVTVTASGGVATFSNLILTTAGTYTLSESATGGLTGPASPSFTVTPAAANQLAFGQQPTNTTAGTAITPAVTVQIEDPFGNVVGSDNTDQVTVGVASGPGTFVASTLSVTVNAGVATFSNLTLTTAGSYTLSAAATGGLTGPASNGFAVTPAAASRLVFVQQPTNTTAGTAITPAVTVQIEDSFGNLVSNDSTDLVTVGIASGPGTFTSSSTTTVTASGGIVTFGNLHLNAAGAYTLSQNSSGGLSGPVSSSFTVTPAAANQLVFGVQPSNTTAGAAIAPAVTVLIEDQFGNFVSTDSSDQVTVGLASGPGTFSGSSTTAVTASAGLATFSNLHLNTAGSYTLSETAPFGTGPASSSFTVTPGAANQLAFGQQPTNTTAGATITPVVTVQIEDAFGNLVSSDSTDQVTVGIATGPATFAITSTTTATASGGIAVFGNLQLNTAGSYTLSESATGGLTGAASKSFTVTAGAANQLVFGVPPSNTTAGAAITPAVTVRIEDSFGNLVSSDSTDAVTVGIASGPGSFTSSSTTMVTAKSGIAIFSNLRLNAVGSYTLSENGTGGLTGPSSNSFTVTPAAGNHLVFGVQPSNTTAGNALAPAVTVQIEDPFGNLVSTDNTDQVTVGVATGPGSFSGGSTTAVTASGGIAVFSNLHLNTAGSYSLSETATGGLTGAASNNFTVAPAAVNQLAFGKQPINTTAGAAITPAVTVLLEDQFGNLVSSDSTDQVTVGLATGPGSFISSTTTVMASAGVATFSNLRLNSAGTYTLSETATGGLTGLNSSRFVVTPAAANQLLFGVQPTNTTAGAVIAPAVTVKLEDPFGNLASGDNSAVTIALATGAAGAALQGTLTEIASGGVATFGDLSITLAATGYTLTARTGSLAGAPSSAFAITPAGATHLVVNLPGGITAGSTFTFTVTAQDPFNNTATGYGGTVHFSSSDPAALLPADSTLAGGTGSFNATFETAGPQTLTVADTLVASLSAQSVPSVVSAAAGTRLVVNVPSSADAGSPVPVTVSVLDPFNNLAAGYTGTVHFASSDPLATLPADYTFTVGPGGDNGTHTFSVLFGTPVNQTLTITDLATDRITTTAEVPVLPAGAIDPDVEAPKPDRTATASSAVGLTSVTLTVFLAPSDGSDIKALTAILPLLIYGTAPVAPAGALTLAAYEVRVLHAGDGDVADVVFKFPAGPDPTEVPVVEFSQDPQTIPLQPIRPVRMSYFRNGPQGILEVVFNNASLPTVRHLDGTVFTITVSTPAPPVPATLSPPVVSADAPAAGLASTVTFQSTSQLTLTLSASQASQVSVSRSTLIPTGGAGGDDITTVRGDPETAWVRILVEALGDYADVLWQYGSKVLRQPPQPGRSMPPPTPTQAAPRRAGPEPGPLAPPDEDMQEQGEVIQETPAWSDCGEPDLAEWATLADAGPAEPWWGLAASLVGLGLRIPDARTDDDEQGTDWSCRLRLGEQPR